MEKLFLDAKMSYYNPSYQNEDMIKHKTRLEIQLNDAQTKLKLIQKLEKQNIPNFSVIKEISKMEHWHDFYESADACATDFETEFLKIVTDKGDFIIAVDYQGRIEEFHLDAYRLMIPTANKDQMERVYNEVLKLTEGILLLHDFMDLETYLKDYEFDFTCIKNDSDKLYDYFKDRIKDLRIGKIYKGYIINGEAHVIINKYYEFDQNDMNYYFKIAKVDKEK